MSEQTPAPAPQQHGVPANSIVISGLTEAEEMALLARQSRLKKIWLAACILVALAVLGLTLYGIYSAHIIPFEDQDIFRSM